MTFRYLQIALALIGSSLVVAEGSSTAPRALEVPVVKQAREKCGPAALQMVLQYYGAGPEAAREAERAYDPALRGALITDLAAGARRAGYDATVEKLTPESLVALLEEGVPPILLYQAGNGPLTTRHYGVVTAWDPKRAVFTVNDGSARPRTTPSEELEKRWRTAGAQALVVRKRAP